jgi:signal transduction histidine kinase
MVMRRWSLAFAISGFVVAVLMVVTLLVLWNVYIIGDFRTIKELSVSVETLRAGTNATGHDPSGRWAIVSLGSSFLAIILVALSLFFTSYIVNRRYRTLQTDWLNMTTHELKLPTANIQLFAQTLQRKSIGESDRERFLGLILQETRRLDGLVSRILQARRLEGGVSELRLERIELRKWLDDYARRGIAPVFVLQEGPAAMVRVDRSLLEAIFNNLLGNAIKYGDGSAPTVAISHLTDYVHIEVADKGLGIPQKHRKRIFDRFYRVPSREHRRQTGTGLGLYIAKSSVELMGGSIGVRDNPIGKGSVFWFRLPEVK